MNPSGKSAGGGKGGKNKSGGVGSEQSKRHYALTTSREHVLALRKALTCDDGLDKDVTEAFGPFLKYTRNGLACRVLFSTGKRLSKEQQRFGRVEFGRASAALLTAGYTVEDKQADMKDAAARFLFVEAYESEEALLNLSESKVVAMVHFRFTVQGELQNVMAGLPVLLVADAFVAPAAQRKGLGRHLFSLLELIARRENMGGIMMAGYSDLESSYAPFLLSKLKSWQKDTTWEPEEEGFAVYAKSFAAAALAPAATAQAVQALADIENTPPPAAAAVAAVTEKLAAAVPFWETVKVAASVPQEGVAQEEEDEESDEESDGESEDEEETAARVMDELVEMFEQKHGRIPTEDEMAQWRETLRS